MNTMDLCKSFVERTDEILLPRLKQEFGRKVKVKRKGIIEKLLFRKYVLTFDDWDLYEKAWSKYMFKMQMKRLGGTCATIEETIEEVIRELKEGP